MIEAEKRVIRGRLGVAPPRLGPLGSGPDALFWVKVNVVASCQLWKHRAPGGRQCRTGAGRQILLLWAKYKIVLRALIAAAQAMGQALGQDLGMLTGISARIRNFING